MSFIRIYVKELVNYSARQGFGAFRCQLLTLVRHLGIGDFKALLIHRHTRVGLSLSGAWHSLFDQRLGAGSLVKTFRCSWRMAPHINH